MFDSNIGTNTPSKYVKFGRQHHGLLKTHAKRSAGVQMTSRFSDFKILTRGGKEISAPLANNTIADYIFTAATTSVYGPVCLYMHPLAVMVDEDSAGKDFSGYVVFRISGSSTPLISSPFQSQFAFTPSDNSQGMFIHSGMNYMQKPYMVDKKAVPEPVKINWPEYMKGLSFFHASQNGRRFYAARLPSPKQVFNTEFPIAVAGTELSGGMIEQSIALEFNRIAIPDPPSATYESEQRYLIRYDYVDYLPSFLGACVPVGFDPQPEIVRDAEGIAPNSDFSTISLVDGYESFRKEAPIFAAVKNTGVEYLLLAIDQTKTKLGSGTLIAWTDFETGEECDITMGGERGVKVTTFSNKGHATHSYTESEINVFELNGFGGSSAVTLTWNTDVSRSYDYPASAVDEQVSREVLVEADGALLFSDTGYVYIGGKGSKILSPAWPAISGIMPNQNGRLIVLEYAEAESGWIGQKWLRITVEVYNYSSADMVALAVFIETGTLQATSSPNHDVEVKPGTYNGTLHICKTFGRGFVDEITHSSPLVATGVYNFRAYDPLTSSLSAVFPYPVFYF